MMRPNLHTKAQAHQVVLFKNAPRDYLNLGTLKNPYLVSYYIDESFHTTWVVRGRTKFKTLKGEEGLKFAISDHQFVLPKVETVMISDLPEYFKTTGPGVDIILGRDFLTANPFLFFKMTQNGLQLSRSCINRCKWPDRSDSSLDFYTAWDVDENDKTKAGIAAFVNICSPFSTWRPYKPSFWDPKEDIGLCAITLAMKTAAQIPPLNPGKVINIITNDKYAFEMYAQFLNAPHNNLSNSDGFQSLNPRLRDILNLFFEYRKNYAVRNGLEELSCVRIVNYRKQENRARFGLANLEYAMQLAKLGARMKEFDAKGQLESQLSAELYYHFDSKRQVVSVPRKEVNKTLREILYSYQQLADDVSAGLSEYAPSDGETTPTPTLVATHHYTHGSDAPFNSLAGGEESGPVLPTVPNVQERVRHRHLVDFNLEEELEKMHKSGLSTFGLRKILNDLDGKKASPGERASILRETRTQLKDLMGQAEEKGLGITERIRRNCDLIMAGALKQQEDLTINAALVAKHFKGVVEGYFIGTSQETAAHSTQGDINSTSPTVDPPPTRPPPTAPVSSGFSTKDIRQTNPHENTRDTMSRKRLEKQRLPLESGKRGGELPGGTFGDSASKFTVLHFTQPWEPAPSSEKPTGTSENAKDIPVKARTNIARLRMKAAEARLESVEAELAAKFAELDLKFAANRRGNTGQWKNGGFHEGIKESETYGNLSAKQEPIDTMVLGGVAWPQKKGRGQFLGGVEHKSEVSKSQRAEIPINVCSNLVTKLHITPMDTPVEIKGPNQVNRKTGTEPHQKAPITLIAEKIGPSTDKPSHKSPIASPRGTVTLLSIDVSTLEKAKPELSGNSKPVMNEGPQSHIGNSINKETRTAKGFTPKQLALMTELSAGGFPISLEKPIGTLIDSLVVSPELRKTMVSEVNRILGENFLCEDEFAQYPPEGQDFEPAAQKTKIEPGGQDRKGG